MDKRKLRAIEEAMLHHIFTLNLPCHAWSVEGDVLIIKWAGEGIKTKEARYKL